MNFREMFKQAVGHHHAGRFAEAEELYHGVLKIEPLHPDANHNLGLMAMQLSQAEMGLPYLQAAWEADPSIGAYWLTLTECLLETGHSEDALLFIEDAIRRGIDLPQVQQLLMRAKSNLDTSTKPVETIIDENAAMAGHLEEGSQVAEQLSQHAFKEAQPVLPEITQASKNYNTAKPGKSAPHREKNPSAQEKNTLVILFAEGRYTEAEALAMAMTQDYPQHGFGWKVLGAVLKQTGRNADALDPMQKAVMLTPSDAEAHNNLGVLLQTQGKLKAALVSMRKALKLKPDYANAHNSLGSILDDMGRVDAAQSSYRRALEINPDLADAHNNLGALLKENGQPEAALASLCRAIEIRPDYAKAHNNLGVVLSEIGQLDAAQASCRRALGIDPAYAEASYNLGNIFCYLDDFEQASIYYQKTINIEPDDKGLEAAVNLAIVDYLKGNIEQCRLRLMASQAVLAKTGSARKNIHAYWYYLDKLLAWRSQSKPRNNQAQYSKIIHVVGESHSLATHGMVVSYKNEEMQCVAEWMSGCKQWHLGNNKPNKYKHKFEAVMARLPRESLILLIVGEIDCRHDEGIIKAWEKHPSKALDEIMQSTVDGYIDYVAAISARYGHRIIISGVPATNVPLDLLDSSMAKRLVNLIRAFNVTLKRQALAAGMEFLDVYALTDRGDGIASGDRHIDGSHLLPCAVVEAFDKYCILH